MIGQTEITEAKQRITPHIRATPVLALEAGLLCDHELTLKLEHTQITGSFKVRGAFNSILSATTTKAGVVATSGGNHGAAVAHAASKLGLKSTVFAPALSGPLKVSRMRDFGAEVVVMDEPFPEIIKAYDAFAAKTGALAIHPYDAPATLAGQGTLGLEIENQVAGIDTLVVSVGGGGLIGGIASWFGKRIRIVAVETELTAAYAQALQHGYGTEILPTGISASALGAPSIGAMPWQALEQANVTSVLVSEEAVFEAQRKLWDSTRLVGEPGAATALAAITSGAYVPERNERVCVLVCGGNAAPDWFID